MPPYLSLQDPKQSKGTLGITHENIHAEMCKKKKKKTILGLNAFIKWPGLQMG